jgi:hypothetical protein
MSGQKIPFKGQSLDPDSWAEAISHMASYSPRKSIQKLPKFDPAMSLDPAGSDFFCQSSPLIFKFSSKYIYM